jgi:transcriptional regulator NrdR family protein
VVYCPKCSGETKVYNTREVQWDNSQIRNRQCMECGHRFRTKESTVAVVERRWEDGQKALSE